MKCFMICEVSPALQRLLDQYEWNRKPTWLAAIHTVVSQGAFNLIETGCFRGTTADGASTLILAQLAKDMGGWLDSYELNPANIKAAKKHLDALGLTQYVAFHEGDSVTQLAARNDPIHFAYLDSFDCGLGPDYSPCQRHQLAELEAVLPLMRRESAIMMDDHIPATGGKTKLAIQRLERLEWQKEAEGYQILYTTGNSKRLVPHRFAVLTGHLSNYAKLAASTIYYNRGLYCLRHGYDLRLCRCSDPALSTAAHVGAHSYTRLREMLRLLESGAYEWVWCVGCDTLVTNYKVRLEDLVAETQSEAARKAPFPALPKIKSEAPPPALQWVMPKDWKTTGEKHVIYCGEAVAGAQADSFLVRSSPEGIAYVRDLMDLYPQYRKHPWVENQTMIDLRWKYAAITCIMPQHRLNAYDYRLFHHMGAPYTSGRDCYGNRGQWEPGDFLVHWPAQTYEQRLALLDKYNPQVIQ